jgi:hypothetical protein
MTKKTINWRLALALFVVAILVLFQFIPHKGGAGAECMMSLVNPSTNNPTSEFATVYGFPLIVVETYTSGCFESQTTHITSWSAAGLLVDILLIVLVGTLPYWLSVLSRRFRRHNTKE